MGGDHTVLLRHGNAPPACKSKRRAVLPKHSECTMYRKPAQAGLGVPSSTVGIVKLGLTTIVSRLAAARFGAALDLAVKPKSCKTNAIAARVDVGWGQEVLKRRPAARCRRCGAPTEGSVDCAVDSNSPHGVCKCERRWA